MSESYSSGGTGVVWCHVHQYSAALVWDGSRMLSKCCWKDAARREEWATLEPRVKALEDAFVKLAKGSTREEDLEWRLEHVWNMVHANYHLSDISKERCDSPLCTLIAAAFRRGPSV